MTLPTSLAARLQAMPTRAFVAVAVAVSVALVGFAGSDVGAQEETIEIYKSASADFESLPDAPFFMAIVGTDDRPGVSGARADAIHVVGVNPGAGAATMIDIPRDTYVDIPGHGRRKINDAHAFGGAELMGATLSGLTGANIQYVITTNFEGFQNLVDAVGGVDAEIPIPVHDVFSGAAFDPGVQHLNGGQALAFARSRKAVPRGDFTRSWHQGLLIMAALDRVHAEEGSHRNTMHLSAILMRHLRTKAGVGITDLYKLGRLARQVDSVGHFLMPGTTGSAGGASVVLPTPPAANLFADFRDDAIIGDPSQGDTGPRL